MCQKKNHFGARFVLFSLVLLLVCCSAWAFPPGFGTKAAEPIVTESPQEVAVVTQEEVTPVTVSQKSSSATLPLITSVSAPSKTSETLSALRAELENERKLNKADIEELTAKLAQVQADVETLNEDAKVKEEALVTALAVNADQADTIVAQDTQIQQKDAEIKKANSSKGYVKLLTAIGFEDLAPNYSLGGAIGVRFGKHMLAEVGALYKIGNFTSAPNLALSLDRLSVTAGIGWEF